MNKFKKMFTHKRFRYSSMSLILTISVIGILFLINLFVSNYDYKWDLTKDKRYSISDESKTYLNKIKKNIKILVFLYGDPPLEIKNVLDNYKSNCSSLTIEYVDPDQNPGLANKYNSVDRTIANGSVIIESGKKWRMLDMQEFSSQDYQTGTIISMIEQKITGAISYVTEEKDIFIYFLEGHGETLIDSFTTLKTTLDDANYTAKELNLLSLNEIPKDATMVVSLSSKKDISSNEKVILEKYLENGGKLFVSLEPTINLLNLSSVLEKYNIGIDNNYIIENNNQKVIYNHPLNLKPDIQNTEITRSLLSKNLNVVLPGARSLHIIKNSQSDLIVNSLLKTSENSWGETNFTNNSPKNDANDIIGPLTVALSSEKAITNTDLKTKIIVFGDSEFMADQVIKEVGAVGNVDLFMNTINWLSEIKDAINISSKALTTDTFFPTESQVRIILIIIILIPLFSICFGTIIWFKRRHL